VGIRGFGVMSGSFPFRQVEPTLEVRDPAASYKLLYLMASTLSTAKLLGHGASYHSSAGLAKARRAVERSGGRCSSVREVSQPAAERSTSCAAESDRMSPTLLSKRMSQLVRAGVIERRGDRQRRTVVLTPAGPRTPAGVEAWGQLGRYGDPPWIGEEIGDEDHLIPKLCCSGTCTGTRHAARQPGRRSEVQVTGSCRPHSRLVAGDRVRRNPTCDDD